MNKANIFMGASTVGLASVCVVLLSALDAIPVAVSIASGFVCVAACWVMLFTRNADEYTRGLWTAGASVAFAIMLILFLAFPFAEGVYDGFKDAHNGTDNATRDISAIMTISAAIAGFYIGLFYKRVWGV